MIHDVIILGRGLAGAVLTEVLQQRGLRVHIFDESRTGNASLVAAGVVNPIVFKRDIPSWRAGEMLAIADTFYANWQARSGADFWHPLPMVKVFPTPVERDQWERRMVDPESAPFITHRTEPDVDSAINAPHGYGTVTKAAWLNVQNVLDYQKEELLAQKAITEHTVSAEEIIQEEDHIRIGTTRASWLIHCTGPFSKAMGLAPVKGELLVVHIPGLNLKCMVHRGLFVLPIGNDLYRVGSTYDWNNVWTGTTDEARTGMLNKLKMFINVPFEVVEHNSGVRPATKDRRPILGKTGKHEAVFNGLGSRGVLLAPWCAAHLVDHLFNELRIDPEVGLERFG